MPDKTKKIVIFGATNYSEMVCDYFEEFTEYHVVAFTVNREFITKDSYYGKRLVCFENIEAIYPPNECDLFIAVGSSRLNKVREILYNIAQQKGYNLPSFIHPNAYIAPKVSIGKNCMIMECAKVLTRTVLGNNIIIWPSGFVSHNNIIKDNAYIVGQTNGFDEIGENCFLGAGAMIADHIRVAKNNFITMSAVVRKNTEENSIYEGFPARKREGITALDFFDKINNRG